MTLKQLKEALATTNIPVAYRFFPEKANQGPPCITYDVQSIDTFPADGKVYSKNINIDIYLWTKTKDLTKETALETALDTAGLVWRMVAEEYDDDSQVYCLTYEVSINGK